MMPMNPSARIFSPSVGVLAVAETEAAVVALPKSDLLAALAADPAECLGVALALASPVRDLRARLELRNFRSAPGRVLPGCVCTHRENRPVCPCAVP